MIPGHPDFSPLRLKVTCVALLVVPVLSAQESPVKSTVSPVVLGTASCASSGCHGGAGEKNNQFHLWNLNDVHTRSYATLTTARSARMAEALGIGDPTRSARCTTCHAPALTVDPKWLAPEVKPTEGVACSSCHGTGQEAWLRSHTRPDFSHADRVAAGMRDVKNLYVRANTCVACHQNLDPEITAKGHHPELIFELDGQTSAQPRHWTEQGEGRGAQGWQIGQAVALRELSGALARKQAEPVRDIPRWEALLWLLQRAENGPVAEGSLRKVSGKEVQAFGQMLTLADQLAQKLAADFDPATVPETLKRLAATSGDFADKSVPQNVQARRAERLVLALDRLLKARDGDNIAPAASAGLDKLFVLAQSLPGFDPEAFSLELKAFAATLK